MSTATPATRALLAAPPVPKSPASQLIIDVARKHKVSPFRQLREMVSLNLGRGRLATHEYYSSGCFSPELSPAQKRQFVGNKANFKLNTRLSPLKTTPCRAFIRDKVLYSALLAELGIRTTRTQAVALGRKSYGQIPVLKTVDEIRTFLLETAEYPLFGKPVEGSKSVGSTYIESIDRDSGTLSLADGRTVEVTQFAQEVADTFNDGFILQSAVIQHPALQRIAGKAVGTLRVVTLRDEKGISPLYAAWKIPSPTAMSDNFWQAGSMLAEVDVETGQLQRCKQGSGLAAEWIETHPVSGENVIGFQIPHWKETRHIACKAHALFPEFGIFGWDIAMTEEGPLIIECNGNPFHALYQTATGRGILNEDFKPRFEAAADYSARSAKRG